MKTTVNFQSFYQAFVSMGRKDQFSYEGLEMLFDYLEQLEGDTGEELELDVIALCCDYTEDSPEDIVDNYSLDIGRYNEEEHGHYDDWVQAVAGELSEQTIVIGVTSDNGIVYTNY